MQFAALDVNAEIKVHGTTATVANDDIAKLSYYLNCVSTCVPGVIEAEAINHQNYRYFSRDLQAQIVVLCAILSPSFLEGSALHLVSHAEMASIDPNHSNAFLKVTTRKNLVLADVDEERAVGLNLRNTQITEKMIYEQAWANYYYFTPIQNVVAKLENAQWSQHRPIPIHNNTADNSRRDNTQRSQHQAVTTHHDTYVRIDSRREEENCNICCCFCSCLVVIYIILGLTCGFGFQCFTKN
jgi:hypothetical protein